MTFAKSFQDFKDNRHCSNHFTQRDYAGLLDEILSGFQSRDL